MLAAPATASMQAHDARGKESSLSGTTTEKPPFCYAYASSRASSAIRTDGHERFRTAFGKAVSFGAIIAADEYYVVIG